MKVIENYFYTKSHEWIQLLEDGTALIGLSDYAQNELGDLVFVNLPEVGDDLIVGEMFADVESVKAVSDVFAPINGKVLEINKELLDAPQKINEDPYGAWFVKVEGDVKPETLLDATAYQEYLTELEAQAFYG